MGMSGKTHGMRGWGMFLFGLFVCSLDVNGVELPEKLYFDGNQLVKDALVLEYRKSHPEAMTTYLRARKLGSLSPDWCKRSSMSWTRG